MSGLMNKAILASSAIYAITTGSAVYAAEAAPAQDSATAPANAAPAKPDGTTTGLEEIVVTATRREENLQRIPVTVTAVTAATLAAGGIDSTRKLTQIIPGLTFSTNGSAPAVFIRGLGSTSVAAGDEASVASYVDGVYIADPFSNQAELVNVQRVEVLRGPQGTVFGRNATGGLINVITPDPSFSREGWVSGTYGRTRNSANDADLRGYFTTPLTDNLAGDFAALYKHNDGYVQDLTHGGTLGGKNVYGVRAKLLFKPSDRSKIILTGGYSKQNGSTLVSQTVNGDTAGRNFPGVILPTGPWQSSADVVPRYNYERGNIDLRSSFDLGPVRLETTGSVQKSINYQQTDTDQSNISIAAAAFTIHTLTESQEIRLLSNGGGPFTWLTGVYLFHLDSKGDVNIGNAKPAPGPLVNLELDPHVETTSEAVFAEGTYRILDPLFLTVGARYTTERRTFEQVLNGAVVVPDTVRHQSRPTYHAAVRYQITPDINVYGSYGTGFKSGAFNSNTTVLDFTKPETIRSAEGGVKSQFSKYLRANVSVYNYNYDNLQVTSRAPNNTYITQNAARARIYGGEVELTVIPTPDFSIGGSVAYTHGRYTKFDNAQIFTPNLTTGGNTLTTGDVSGNHLVRAPTFTYSINPSFHHEFASGTLQATLNVFHSGRVYYDYANNFSQKAYALVSASVSFETRSRWTYTISATNLTNAVVAQQIRVGAPGTDELLERPREVSIGARYSF